MCAMIANRAAGSPNTGFSGYSPVQIFTGFGEYWISENNAVQPGPLGDWDEKPTFRLFWSSGAKLKPRMDFHFLPSFEA